MENLFSVTSLYVYRKMLAVAELILADRSLHILQASKLLSFTLFSPCSVVGWGFCLFGVLLVVVFWFCWWFLFVCLLCWVWDVVWPGGRICFVLLQKKEKRWGNTACKWGQFWLPFTLQIKHSKKFHALYQVCFHRSILKQFLELWQDWFL